VNGIYFVKYRRCDSMDNNLPSVLSESLPVRLREAARDYLSDDDSSEEDEDSPGVDLRLIEAFGSTQTGDTAHRQATLLCVLAMRRVLYGWAALECEGDAPERAVAAAEAWVLTGTTPPDWESLCVPALAIRDGEVTTDCDVYRAKPIAEGAASTARFAWTGNAPDGADALLNVFYAASEGVYRPDTMPYDQWLITVALPAAYMLQPLSEEQLYS
jgi:hypothetical protein